MNQRHQERNKERTTERNKERTKRRNEERQKKETCKPGQNEERKKDKQHGITHERTNTTERTNKQNT